MDFSRLSRESLIHEIEQLMKENDRIKMKYVANQVGINESLDDVPSPVFIVSPDYRVVWANLECSKKYSDLLSKKCYQVFFGYEDVCPDCKMQSAIATKKPKLIFTRKYSKDDSVLAIQFSPLYRNGDFHGVLEMHSSIEDPLNIFTVNRDKMLELGTKLAESEARNQRIMKMVTHFTKAMRVPLRSFIGYFHLYSQNQNETLKREYLDVMRINSESLYETLNKLLLFTKPEGFNIEQKGPFTLKKLMDQVLDQVVLPHQNNDHRLKSQDKAYRLEYASTLPDVLVGDEFKLSLALSYVLELAQFLSSHKEIEVYVSDITQTLSKIVIKVLIEGENAFKTSIKTAEYFNLEVNTEFSSLEEYSLALGISLIKNIIASQNGTFDLNVGLEGKFYIELNMTYDKLIPRNEDSDSLDDQTITIKPKILIADYEKPQISLDLMKNYDIYFAHTGDETISQYFKIDPDVTIINVMIEECDGFKVFDEIERRRHKLTPIIAISNKVVDNERAFMCDYGFSEYYSKPLNDEKIINIITNYL